MSKKKSNSAHKETYAVAAAQNYQSYNESGELATHNTLGELKAKAYANTGRLSSRRLSPEDDITEAELQLLAPEMLGGAIKDIQPLYSSYTKTKDRRIQGPLGTSPAPGFLLKPTDEATVSPKYPDVLDKQNEAMRAMLKELCTLSSLQIRLISLIERQNRLLESMGAQDLVPTLLAQKTETDNGDSND